MTKSQYDNFMQRIDALKTDIDRRLDDIALRLTKMEDEGRRTIGEQSETKTRLNTLEKEFNEYKQQEKEYGIETSKKISKIEERQALNKEDNIEDRTKLKVLYSAIALLSAGLLTAIIRLFIK